MDETNKKRDTTQIYIYILRVSWDIRGISSTICSMRIFYWLAQPVFPAYWWVSIYQQSQQIDVYLIGGMHM